VRDDLAKLRESIIVPLRLYELLAGRTVTPEILCPDDKIYVGDKEGHVHFFQYCGRVLDQPGPPDDDSAEDCEIW
jgi:hypothetical protein